MPFSPRWISFGLLCMAAACGPAPKPVVVAPPPTPQPEKPPPFRRSTHDPFNTVRGRPSSVLLSRNANTAEVSSDGRTVALVTRRGGVKVFGPSNPRGTALSIRDVESVRLNADNTRLLALDDEHLLSVFSLPDNKLLLTLPNVDDARFLSPSKLRVYTNCQLSEVDLPASAPASGAPPAATPKVIGPRQCGDVISSSNGNVWLVSEIAGNFPGAGSAYKSLHVVAGPEWKSTRVMHTTEGTPFTDVALSPSGDRVCALKADGSLHWVPSAGGEPEKLEDEEIIAPLAFDSAGDQLLYGSELDSGQREVRLVDFRARILRTLATTAQRRWGFLPGGLQFIAYGDRGADLYDLAANTVQTIVSRRMETDSFVPVSDNTRRFLLGQERRRALDLYWIELP